jgi:phosphatidylserine/phosphatidylglycerophosphate/cardiolipin synthase-like enzyme
LNDSKPILKKTEKLNKLNSDKNRSRSKLKTNIQTKSNKSLKISDSPGLKSRSKSTKSLRKNEESKISLLQLETEKDTPKNKNLKLLTMSDDYFQNRLELISPISYNCKIG